MQPFQLTFCKCCVHCSLSEGVLYIILLQVNFTLFHAMVGLRSLLRLTEVLYCLEDGALMDQLWLQVWNAALVGLYDCKMTSWILKLVFLLNKIWNLKTISIHGKFYYCQTQKNVNSWKISGMLIVYWPITMKFRTCDWTNYCWLIAV